MATVTINFSALRKASRQANSSADKLDDYASELDASINGGLGGLTGGASSYTYDAAVLASRKADDLRNKAAIYRVFSKELSNYAEDADDTDRNVGRSIKSLADKRGKDLPGWKTVVRSCRGIVNGYLGKSDAGKLIKRLWNSACSITGNNILALKKAKDWFKHGNGRYLLSSALAVIGVFGALSTFLKAAGVLVATFPASAVVAIAVAVVAGIALIKSGSDMVYTLSSAWVAVNDYGTEPGLSRYYGGISSVSDYKKKYTTSKAEQNAAKWFDRVGNFAAFAASLGGLFTTRNLPGTKVPSNQPGYQFNKETFCMNLYEKFGFTPVTAKDSNGAVNFVREGGNIKYQFGGNLFGFKLVDDTNAPKPIEAGGVIGNLSKGANKLKSATSSVKCFIKSYQGLTGSVDKVIWSKSSNKAWTLIKEVVGMQGAVLPGISASGDSVTLAKALLGLS